MYMRDPSFCRRRRLSFPIALLVVSANSLSDMALFYGPYVLVFCYSCYRRRLELSPCLVGCVRKLFVRYGAVLCTICTYFCYSCYRKRPELSDCHVGCVRKLFVWYGAVLWTICTCFFVILAIGGGLSYLVATLVMSANSLFDMALFYGQNVLVFVILAIGGGLSFPIALLVVSANSLSDMALFYGPYVLVFRYSCCRRRPELSDCHVGCVQNSTHQWRYGSVFGVS